jgi:hypothetical protein
LLFDRKVGQGLAGSTFSTRLFLNRSLDARIRVPKSGRAPCCPSHSKLDGAGKLNVFFW